MIRDAQLERRHQVYGVVCEHSHDVIVWLEGVTLALGCVDGASSHEVLESLWCDEVRWVGSWARQFHVVFVLVLDSEGVDPAWLLSGASIGG